MQLQYKEVGNVSKEGFETEQIRLLSDPIKISETIKLYFGPFCTNEDLKQI